MDSAVLRAISPLDGRYRRNVIPLESIFSEHALMHYRTEIEIRWLQFLSEQTILPKFSKEADTFLNAIIDNFNEESSLRIKKIEETTQHDVKAVEYFIKEKTEGHAELKKAAEFIHFGCTSEDINNLAYALMLKRARSECLLPVLEQLISALKKLAIDHADQPMLARTHGQPATPTTVGKEIANVIARLNRQLKQLEKAEILGKFNGATGNYNALKVACPDIHWPDVSKQFITRLGLSQNPYTTQIEPHDSIAELFAILMRINSILLDFNRDMWGYISLDYFKQKTADNEVGSSTMPHKVNPIDFENAEGNLGIANALLGHFAEKLPISRFQRDLSDSTVLRNMGVAIGHTVLAWQSTSKGLAKVTVNREALCADLNNHWEVLAEPIQMTMRRLGLEKPYEQLKNFTRGKKITKELMQQFIQELALPADIKQQLLSLTPENYIGYAADLAKTI
ncbi:MAG TPA: adenylosuccinate lyase [Gammaproteobacteria bacterium]|nr:adenylosuccinate lyase [Gammaproteobacteria bacterium]